MNGRILFFGVMAAFAFAVLFLLVLLLSGLSAEDKAEKEISGSYSPNVIVYERQSFGDWADLNGDCLDTRAEILKDRSINPIVLDESGCQVLAGVWIDDYSGAELIVAAEIDIDHVVPLKMAWEFGARNWSASAKREFHNDIDNLAITANSINRSKGDFSPLAWLPRNSELRCKYLTKFLHVVDKYQIALPKEDVSGIEGLVKDFCG